jgi:hypothetical protein
MKVTMNRRDLLKFLGLAATGASAAQTKQVAVGAHVWVFAARQPKFDPTPVAEEIFRQYGAAGWTASN